ncbi:MAG: putative Zn-dependent protease [Cognaticolwellia sp.]|jgi:predicted Zn-dependent protease
MHEGKLLKAERICRHFLQNNKRHIDGMCLLAEIGIELKVYDDAEFLLASALELDPSHIHARSQYLNLLIRLGKYKAAEQQVQKLLVEQPDNLSFEITKASVINGLGKTEQAIALFEQVIAQDNKTPAFQLQLGHALKAKGDITKAVAAYQKAYQLNPSYGDAFWSLANTKTYRFSDEEITKMQAEQENKDLAITDKVQLHFATGKAFEDRKEYNQAYLTLMAHWDNVLPGFVLTVNHEDVVDNLEKQVRTILDFCDLEFEQSCLDFHKTKRNIKTPSSEQVRQPIYKSATEQWQHFEEHLTPLKKALNID